MNHSELDTLISEFHSMIPYISGIFTPLFMHDWGPVFAKAKQIQEAFNSGVRYPTKIERDQAWIRFNDARTLAYERANSERSRFRMESESYRNEILGHLKYARYNGLEDIVFFFLPTTVEDMKKKSVVIQEAGQMLSQYKQKMLKEHKEECFSRIEEMRQSHDVFWERYRRDREEKRDQSRQRRTEVAERIQDNIRTNHERLKKAQSAYERAQTNMDTNQEKLRTARSSEFAERVAAWISEDEEKIRSIAGSIGRIKSWIREDESRLSDIHQRMNR